MHIKSTGNTISMTGNSVGYGASSGMETFDLTGYNNTIMMEGANDSVNIDSGGYDVIDLNSTGFTGRAVDAIGLGQSAFDIVGATHALYGSDVYVDGYGGPNAVSFVNHGGISNILLGYAGDPALLGPDYGNRVTLNGDAENHVTFVAGGYADVDIGSASDQFFAYSSVVSLTGIGNTVLGGDEIFTVTAEDGGFNTISLGNANDTVTLAGPRNVIRLGDGNDNLTLTGRHDAATLGGGNNTVTLDRASADLRFAAGHAGARDSLTMTGGFAKILGGDENFTIESGRGRAHLDATLGNGNNTIHLNSGAADLVLGSSIANTGHNLVTLGSGSAHLTLNGGTDVIDFGAGGAGGGHTATLNATLLGTSLTTAGVFDKITLTQDANAAITDTGINSGLLLTLDADSVGGFGDVSITGLSSDDLAHIHLAGASAYTLTTDQTAAGGITLHFAHGSIDLVGLQSVPIHLFG